MNRILFTLFILAFTAPAFAQTVEMPAGIKEFKLFLTQNWQFTMMTTYGLSGERFDTVFFQTPSSAAVTGLIYSHYEDKHLVLGFEVGHLATMYLAYTWTEGRWVNDFNQVLGFFGQFHKPKIEFIRYDLVKVEQINCYKYFEFDFTTGQKKTYIKPE